MASNDPKIVVAKAVDNGIALRDVTADSGPTPEKLAALVDGTLTEAMRSSIKRKVLTDPEILLLREPLLIRMRAGLLAEESLRSFITFTTHGGLPLETFKKDPLLPLDRNLTSSLVQGEWLPPHLKERVADPATDFGIQQQRIIDVMQSVMRKQQFSLPLFFLGSSAVPSKELPYDIDIGTSCALRNAHMKAYDDATGEMRSAMASNPLILGDKNDIGAVFDHMVLSLGVSVARYGRALRVTPDVVYAIESNLRTV